MVARLAAIVASRSLKHLKLLLSSRRPTLCSYFYRVKRYIYNSMSFASGGKLITYLRRYQFRVSFATSWLIFRCFVTLQAEHRTAAYVKSALRSKSLKRVANVSLSILRSISSSKMYIFLNCTTIHAKQRSVLRLNFAYRCDARSIVVETKFCRRQKHFFFFVLLSLTSQRDAV